MTALRRSPLDPAASRAAVRRSEIAEFLLSAASADMSRLGIADVMAYRALAVPEKSAADYR